MIIFIIEVINPIMRVLSREVMEGWNNVRTRFSILSPLSNNSPKVNPLLFRNFNIVGG